MKNVVKSKQNENKLRVAELDEDIRKRNEKEQILWYRTVELERISKKIEWLILDCKCLIDDYDSEILQYGYHTGYVQSNKDINKLLNESINLLDNFNKIIEYNEFVGINEKNIILVKECFNKFEKLADEVMMLSSQMFDLKFLLGDENVYIFKSKHLKLFAIFFTDYLKNLSNYYEKIINMKKINIKEDRNGY